MRGTPCTTVACGVALLIALIPFQPTHPTPLASAFSADAAPLPSFATGAFIENVGQLPQPQIRFYSTGNPRIAFTNLAVLMEFRGPMPHLESRPGHLEETTRALESGVMIQLGFGGANPTTPIGMNRLPHATNFFLRNEPSGWHIDVASYEKVLFRGLYPGIDLVVGSAPLGVKLDFVVEAGARISDIAVTYEGVDYVRAVAGGLTLGTPMGDLRDTSPVAYQGDRTIACTFVPRDANTVGFECPRWDTSSPGIVDPLVYATFLDRGGGGTTAQSIVVDSGGNAYVTGSTHSPLFPVTPGAFDRSLNGTEDAFLVKLNAAGTDLLYATYLGGSGLDDGESIAVDPWGNAYVSGTTSSSDFPIVGGFDATWDPPEPDAFLAMISSTGSDLAHSTYLGGTGHEGRIALDVRGGRVVVTGLTNSSDFPTTPGAFDRTLNGTGDAFVTSVDVETGDLVFSTLLGGSGSEGYNKVGIRVDGNGLGHVCGETASVDFPFLGGMDAQLDGTFDAYLARFDPVGGLLYSTYLGGSLRDGCHALDVDATGSVHLAGYTESTNFPGALNSNAGGSDAVVAKVNAAGDSVVFARLVGGGSVLDYADSIALDPTGMIHIAGTAFSPDFPFTADAIDMFFEGFGESFVVSMDAAGSLVFSTFLGGAGYEQGHGIAADSAGNAYVTGHSNSADFPVTPGAFDTDPPAGVDAYVVKISPSVPPVLPDLVLETADVSFSPPGPVPAGTSVTVRASVHNEGTADATQAAVRFHDGPSEKAPRIDGDSVIPFISRSGGRGTASVPWVAMPEGGHMICAWADPDSLILESNESNNVACGLLDVIPSPLPNLVLSSADLVLTPLPPFANGTLVQVVTMVHNVGGSSSSPTAVRFYDGVPPSPRVGTDQPLASLPTSGTEVVSVTWEAVPPGTHDICALVDPENLVAESDETDNGACTPASVYEVRSDYVPSLPQPGSPLIVGLSVPVFLSVIIENIGNASGGESTVLAFYNETAPATPFASTLIAPLPVLGASARLVARWIPPPVLGAYRVVAAVDYERQLFEWDESNNDHTWTINVVAGPVTTLTLGTPSVSAAQTYVTSATPLSLAVLDGSGTGVRSTRYRVDGGAWAEYSSGPFTLDGETAHLLEWFSEDFAGNVEAIQSRVLVVDDTPPTTTAVIGDPQHLAGGTFVTSSTPIMLSAQDGGPSPVGLAHLEYRIDGGPWSSYSKPFPSGGEGTHTVEIRSADLLGNAEPITIVTMIVDDTAPSATIDVGEPKYADPALFVTSSTPIRLPVSDGGPIPVGLASLEYRVDGDAWNSYAAPFALVGLDGTRIIDVRATDHLGNAATVRAAVVLDNTPPASTLRSASSPYTVDTAFTLGASDAGSGVLLTEYRINGSPMWIVYNWAFALPPGDHVVHLRSTDNLGNVEPERTVSVTIAGTLVAQPKTNWKPWVATIFTIVLAVLGAWSSLRNPVFLGRNSWARTFALTALPFVAAEAATGIVSALTGALAIPPGLGPGAVVDTGILIVGTLVFVLCRKTPLSQSR